MRNPYRITIHPDTGEIVIGETGWRTWEEVNLAEPELTLAGRIWKAMGNRLRAVSQIVEDPDDYLYFVDVNDGEIGRWTLES